MKVTALTADRWVAERFERLRRLRGPWMAIEHYRAGAGQSLRDRHGSYGLGSIQAGLA